MIALQVAAGIVLAYIVIVNQKKLLAFGGWLFSALGILVAIGAIIWAGVAAVQFAGSAISPKAWDKLWTLVEIIPVFILASSATIGMLMLGSLFVRKEPKAVSQRLVRAMKGEEGKDSRAGCIFAITLGIGMLIVNYAISFPIWGYTPIGDWYGSIDTYGRSHGWQDGLSILFCAVLWQWVWIPLAIYFGVQRLRAGNA